MELHDISPSEAPSGTEDGLDPCEDFTVTQSCRCSLNLRMARMKKSPNVLSSLAL